MKELVSIITPSYNAEIYIAQTIESVMRQSYANWEMLISDDGSTDQTAAIVEDYQKKDQRIKLFKLKQNSGVAVARNLSIKHAKGRFIAFLDADDLWYPEKLTVQVDVMLKKKLSVSFSSYRQMNENGEDIKVQVNAIEHLYFSKLLKNNYIGNLTGMYDAKRLGKIYNPDLKKRQDWCLWLEALRLSDSFAYGIQEPLAKYRVRENSISSHKIHLLKYNFQVYHKFLKYNVLKSSVYLIQFLKEYFFERPKYISNV